MQFLVNVFHRFIQPIFCWCFVRMAALQECLALNKLVVNMMKMCRWELTSALGFDISLADVVRVESPLPLPLFASTSGSPFPADGDVLDLCSGDRDIRRFNNRLTLVVSRLELIVYVVSATLFYIIIIMFYLPTNTT